MTLPQGEGVSESQHSSLRQWCDVFIPQAGKLRPGNGEGLLAAKQQRHTYIHNWELKFTFDDATTFRIKVCMVAHTTYVHGHTVCMYAYV